MRWSIAAAISASAAVTACASTIPARQLVASIQPNAPEREELVAKLAVGYAQLECAIAAACAKSRDSNATPDEITIAEAKKKTDDDCSTLKSDFPKSKRPCP